MGWRHGRRVGGMYIWGLVVSKKPGHGGRELEILGVVIRARFVKFIAMDKKKTYYKMPTTPYTVPFFRRNTQK
jgi:hypothetical protein